MKKKIKMSEFDFVPDGPKIYIVMNANRDRDGWLMNKSINETPRWYFEPADSTDFTMSQLNEIVAKLELLGA